MSLFSFGKKKEEKKTHACACGCGCASNNTPESPCNCSTENKGDFCSVKVLGAGCASCHKQ